MRTEELHALACQALGMDIKLSLMGETSRSLAGIERVQGFTMKPHLKVLGVDAKGTIE